MSFLQPFSNGFPPSLPVNRAAMGEKGSLPPADRPKTPSDPGDDPRGAWLIAAADQERRRRAAQPNLPSNGGAAGEPPLRFWTTDVNRHYLEAIAERESRGQPDHGYGARNGDALGRYQLLPSALVDAKWFEPGPDGGLVPTGRAAAFGVQSLEDWRRNAPAQEEAMRDFSRSNEEQATKKGLWDRLGLVYQGRQGQIAITPAGIAAAVHREGAGGTRRYFDKLAASGWDSKSADLSKKDLRVETRLREFQAVPYTPYTQRVRDRLRTDPENGR